MSSFLVVAGVVVHLILVYSIFDIYYTSPVVTGVPAHEIAKGNAPADRVVVISADGLRLDTFTQNPELSPFLHSIIRSRKGISGVSRSHVPTESRPGHVAIFAGFTEDVSAVARGWKHNPVPFDSVLNRSSKAWLWGSPDIVSLFDDSPHVDSFSYSAEDEDFESNEAFRLDEWVFERVQEFLSEHSRKSEAISGSRQVFFLHLLGLDTNGHGNKPHSKEYKDNLKVVDSGISRMQSLFDEVFPDGKTAWIFTSDHGMTDWGSHGAGSDEEVLTPFVGWGAGFKKGGSRQLISQVDLAPLMAALLGTAIPVNSVGVLPVDALSVTPKYLFRSCYSNFLQLKEQILVLRNDKAHRLWFQEYSHFGDRALRALEVEMLKLADLGRFSAAASIFVQNSASMKLAIFHYHRYDRSFLGAAVSMVFLGWVVLVWCWVTRTESTTLGWSVILRPKPVFSLILIFFAGFCLHCRLPWTNFVYVLLPVFLFSMIENITSFTHNLKLFGQDVIHNYATYSFAFLVRPFVAMMGLSVALFIFVIVFMDRRFLAVLFLLMTIVPAAYPSNSVTADWTRCWQLCCVSLLPFPFLSTVGRHEIPILCAAAPLLLAICLRRAGQDPKRVYEKQLSVVCFVTCGLIFLTSYLIEKPPLVFRLISWASLPVAFIAPLFTSTIISQRIMCYLVALFIPYSLLSIAYESTFILLLFPLLLLFLRFEFHHLTDDEFLRLSADTPTAITKANSRVHVKEIRRAILCMCFVLASLFGTGNFASLNSFNPSALRRFISVFSPFTMASLILSKLLIPVLMTTLVFSAVLRFDRNAMQRLSCLVLIITDLMAMCFFHQLKDEGSWLDIGTSISQYMVAMCIAVALLILMLCSSCLMTTRIASKMFSTGSKIHDCSL